MPVNTLAPDGDLMRVMRPDAIWLLTKRSQCTAGKSAVKRPCPRTKTGSSSRRIDRPTQVVPDPFVGALMRSARDGANQIAAIFRIRLDIFNRIDGLGRGLSRRAKCLKLRWTVLQ